MLTPLNQDVIKINERVEVLEQQAIQNDFMICGLKARVSENSSESEELHQQSSHNWVTMDLVLDHLKNVLEIQIEMKDINYAYRTKKTKDSNLTSYIGQFCLYI